MSKVFTAASDYLFVNTAVLTAFPFTMSIWVKETALGSNENHMSLGTQGTNNNRYSVVKSALEIPRGIQHDTTDGIAAAGTTVPDTAWHLYTAVFNSDSSRSMYFDGGSRGNNSTAKTAFTPDCLFIGRLPSGGNNTVGKSAYCGIWNRALSDAEIANLASKTPLDAAPSGLVGYYILSGDALDSAGSNNLTVNGSAGYDTADMPPINSPQPACGALTIAGLAPTAIATRTVEPAVGLATMQGFALVSQVATVTPTVGAVTMAGQVPVVSIVGLPTSAFQPAALALVGQSPSLLRTRVVVPDLVTGTADEEGLIPTILWEWSSRLDVSVPMVMRGLQPIMLADGTVRIAPTTGLVVMGGLNPTLELPVGQSGLATPFVGQIQFVGSPPDLQFIPTASPDVAPLILEGLPPNIVATLLWHDPPPTTSKQWHRPTS